MFLVWSRFSANLIARPARNALKSRFISIYLGELGDAPCGGFRCLVSSRKLEHVLRNAPYPHLRPPYVEFNETAAEAEAAAAAAAAATAAVAAAAVAIYMSLYLYL